MLRKEVQGKRGMNGGGERKRKGLKNDLCREERFRIEKRSKYGQGGGLGKLRIEPMIEEKQAENRDME